MLYNLFIVMVYGMKNYSDFSDFLSEVIGYLDERVQNTWEYSDRYSEHNRWYDRLVEHTAYMRKVAHAASDSVSVLRALAALFLRDAKALEEDMVEALRDNGYRFDPEGRVEWIEDEEWEEEDEDEEPNFEDVNPESLSHEDHLFGGDGTQDGEHELLELEALVEEDEDEDEDED